MDIPVGTCQDRVQRRVGHPTLVPGRLAEGVVKRMAGDLRPPHRKEGFHAVLRCRSDEDLSEAVAVLSSTVPSSSGRDGVICGNRPVPFTGHRAPNAPPDSLANAIRVGEWGGGHGYGGVGGAENVRTSWGPSQMGFTPTPAPQSGGMHGGNEALLAWDGSSFPGAISGYPGNPPVDGPFGSVPAYEGMTACPRPFGARVAQAFPAGAVRHSTTGEGGPMPREGDHGAGPVLAWGGEQPDAGGGDFDVCADGTGGGVNNNGDASAIHDPGSYPSLPGGDRFDKRNTNRRFTGSITTERQPKEKTFPLAGGFGSSSLSTIAKLTPQAQMAASSARRPRQQQSSPDTRQLTPAEIAASFSELQAPARVLDPRDVGVAAASARAPPSRPAIKGVVKRNKNEARSPQPDVLPLGPSSLEEWTRRLDATATATTAAGSVRSGDDSSSGSTTQETSKPRDLPDGRGGPSAGPGGNGPEGGEDRLDFSDGEAFFVLEDMFGGLLPPDTLEKVFLESRSDLQKAVKKGFQLCEDLWGRGDELVSPASSLSDTTTADALLAPSTTTSTDSSSNGNGSELWDDGSQAELEDVSEWTHEQIDTLTELCLAFEEIFPRETIIAALAASNHEPTSAAQLLLDPLPRSRRRGAGWGRGKGGRGRKKNSRHGSGRGAPQRERKMQPNFDGVGTSGAGLSAVSLLGVTCGADKRASGVGAWQEGAGAGTGAEEEEGDEGLSSEEYRAIANDAAEAMKAWFQKAAEAFTRGGRNGGAAAADPSHIGQRWKKKMEAANLRAARECFRERNPLVRVGYTVDGVSVLKVLALPRPSQCSVPGQLSVDLHLLRRAEALNVLEAVLHAVRPRERAASQGRIFHQRPPRGASSSQQQHEALDYPESFAAATATALGNTSPASAAGEAVHGAGYLEGGQNGNCVFGAGTFTSLEVVVGRGAHSVAGVPRLRPCVVSYLASKGFRADAVELHKGQGAIVVGLR
ncbi:unnamed protein product [Scytosiphon promiscuus]